MKKLILGLILISSTALVSCKKSDYPVTTDLDSIKVEQDSIITDTIVVDTIKNNY